MTLPLARDDSYCTNGSVRLWSAFDNTPDNEGIIQTCINNTWYALCDSYYCQTFAVACKQLGYPGAVGQWHITT